MKSSRQFKAALPDTPGGGVTPRPLANLHVLLTGATGFIGRHLQPLLLRDAARVTAAVRPSVSATPPPRRELVAGVNQLPLDLTDASAWQAALHDVDVVISLAGSVRGRSAVDFAAANVAAPTALAAAINRLPQPPRVLLVSSLAASAPELSHYAASKRAGETALISAGVACDVLRPPAVYGPGDTELAGLFNSIRLGLMPRPGPADQRLAFLHVSDLVHAIVTWLHADPPIAHEPYAIDDGTPNGYSWPDIAAALAPGRRTLTLPVPAWLLRGLGYANLGLAHLSRYQPMLSPGKARELCYPAWLCNNAPFSAATGWQPQRTLSQLATRQAHDQQ